MRALLVVLAFALSLVASACDSEGADEPLACEVTDECAAQCVPTCDVPQEEQPDISCTPCQTSADPGACYEECNAAKDEARAEWQEGEDERIGKIVACGMLCEFADPRSVCIVGRGIESSCDL